MVAIKFLPRAAAGAVERQRLQMEARAAAALNHPNIAQVYAIEEIDGEPLIVMERIQGRELRALVSGGQGEAVDVPTVGRELHAEYVLTGHYLREGGMIRLAVELVNARANDMVWREDIEVQYENAFKLQDIVARKVLRGLKVQFSKKQKDRMTADVPGNPLAYEYHLRALACPTSLDGSRLAIQLVSDTPRCGRTSRERPRRACRSCANSNEHFRSRATSSTGIWWATRMRCSGTEEAPFAH
jgi:hypothetical protein